MKKVWFIKILKTFGICLASIIGAVVLTGGVMYLVGALNPKKVELTNMSFEQKAYVLDGVTISDNGEVSISNYDSTIKLIPENEDATELDVNLSSSGNSIAKPVVLDNKNVATETTVGKVGTNLIFDLTHSLGGTFDLTASQDFLTASTKVFVDLKLNSFNLTSNINNDNIYPGSQFTISLLNCSPATYLRKPATSNTDFYSIYGQNYFNKNPIFFSSNESIATVNQTTGEVTILDEGEFTIFCYVPRTYKLNASLPSREDFLDAESYFNALSNFCVLGQKTFTSKSIEVGSITSSTEVHNVNVFTTYKYSFNDLYKGTDNQLPLNLKIHVPTGTSFSDSDLDYRAKDIEIYEGIYDNETSSYSILPFKIDEDTNERISEHFIISKTYQKYPYWEITPIDYYLGSQNYCLIAVIDDNEEDEKIINGSSLLKIEENSKFHFSSVKVVNNYTPSTLTLEKVEYLLNIETSDVVLNEGIILTKEDGTVFNLKDLAFKISPDNASYKKIAFFIDASTPSGVLASENSTELKPETDGENEGKILIRAKNTGVAYINAVVVKTKNNALGETFYSGQENPEVVEMSSRVRIKLVITSKINFENFDVSGVDDNDKVKVNEELTGFKVTKGKTATLTFASNSDLLTVYNQNLFKVYTNAQINSDSEKISINISELGTNSKIAVTGIESGETVLYLELNGEIIKQFNIQVVSDAIKSLSLSESSLNISLDVDGSSNTTNKWNFSQEESSETFDINIIADGNNDKNIMNLNLDCSVTSDILEVTLAGDYKKLTIKPKKYYNGTITLRVSTQNSDNQTIYSNTLQITISVPEIEFTRNDYNNTTIIAGKTYEKVVDGATYDILRQKDSDNKFIFEAKIKDTNKNAQNLFKIVENDNYKDYKFVGNINNNVLAELKIETIFGLEETIYILILPQYQLTTTTISSNDTEITLGTNNISVYENTYDDATNKIISQKTSKTYSIGFEELDETKGTLNGDIYEKPEIIFENGYDKVLVRIGIDGIELTSNLNIELTAGVNLTVKEEAKKLYAGQTVNLLDLLEISSNKYSLKIAGVQQNLPNGLEYSNGELTISSDFHDLTANILINVEIYSKNSVTGEETYEYTYTDFNLTLNIAYFELFLNSDYLIDENTLILLSNEFDLSKLILSATKTSVDGTVNIKDKVEFYNDGAEITSINTNATITAKIVIDGNEPLSKEIIVVVKNGLVEKQDVTIYETITYSVSNLINITETEYETKILNSAKISGCETTLSEDPIKDNLLNINGYDGEKINVKFEILGQEVSLEYDYEKLLTVKDSLTLYSNTQKALFDKKSGVTYIVQLQDASGNELQLENVTLENNTLLKIGTISSEVTFKVLIQTKANGYEGGTFEIEVTAKPITISQNRTEIISGYTYRFADLITISDTPEGLKIGDVNNKFNKDSEGNVKVEVDVNTQIIVNLEVGNDEDKLTLKTFTFNVICVEIECDEASIPTAYNGQTLDKTTLLSYINLKSGSIYVNGYKSLVEITVNDTLIESTTSISETNKQIKYSLGSIEKTITLNVAELIFTNGNGYNVSGYVALSNYNVYSGTTISNYVQVGYLNGTNFISLSNLLRFELVESDKNSELIKNLATDFETTGKFTLNKDVNGDILIKITLNGVNEVEQTIKFTITNAIKTSEQSIALAVGDFSININKSVYFGSESNKIPTTYEFEKVQAVDADSSYIIAKTNGKFVILKNGVSVASLEDNYVTLTSNLDSMTITIYGYINANITGLTSESTKEEYVSLIISLTKINVSMQSASGYTVSKKVLGTSEYNQIEKVTNSVIKLSNPNDAENSILIAVNPNDNSYQTFTDLKIKTAFVCDNNGSVLYQQDDKSGFIFNDTTITLSTFVRSNNLLTQQTITLGKVDNSWQLSFNSTLINFVALTFEYEVNYLQKGEINVLLSPNETLTYVGSTIESNFYSYGEENKTTKVAPLIITSNNQAVYSYYDLISVKEKSSVSNIQIVYTYFNTTIYFNENSSKYENNYDSTSGVFRITLKELTETDTENNIEENKVNYYIGFKFGGINYYYPLNIQEVNISTKVSRTTETETELVAINSESPLSISSVLADNENTLDLRQFIYFETKNVGDTCITTISNDFAQVLLNRLNFAEVSNESYSVSTNGTLTINSTINGVIEIKFNVCGVEYILYLKGIEINLNYNGNNTLNAGKTYFISSIETQTNNATNITTSLTTNAPTGECKDYLSFENYSYVYGANTITEQSLFDIDRTNNRIVVTYAGETLGIFTKIGNYYQISNLVGGFGLNVVIRFKESVSRISLKVSSVIITPNYVNPSIVNGREYQNILSNTSTNLNNLINCETTLTFSLCEYNNNVSIIDSNLKIDAVTSELLLKIKAEAGEIVEYYYVRVIPKNKITLVNNNKQFNVIKGDTINLTDFIKIEEFSKLDSQNNPVYVPNLNCYYTNENCEQDYKVANPLSYAVTEDFSITFSIDGLKDTLTFNVVEITSESFGTLSCYIGENLDLKSEILNVINANNISLTPVLSFSNDNNDISSNGVFRSVVANPETEVKVTINNLTLLLKIEVNDFELEPKYPINSYYVTTNDVESRYANVYATQSLDLTNVLKVLTKYEANLNFELTSSSLSSYTIEDISNKIIYKVNGVKIFEIDNSSHTLNVFNSLNDLTLTNNELLITLNCGVSVNDCKTCKLNLRLMKTELTLTKVNENEPTDLSNPYTIQSNNLIKVEVEETDGYYFDLKNVAQAKTICLSDNIYLTNELSYVLLSGIGEIANTNFIKLKMFEGSYLNHYDFQVQVTLGSEDNNKISKIVYLSLNFDESEVTITETEINEFSFKGTKFVKTSEDKTILSSGEITAIYSDDYLVTFKKPNGETFNAYHISQNGKDIMWISSTGTFEILVANYHDIKLKIEAKSGSLFILEEISFVKSESSNNFAQNEFQVTVDNIYEYENGIKYYVLYSNIESAVNSSMGSYNFNNEIVKYENSKFLANVSEITYVRVEAKNSDDQSYFINFKIYPTTINKLYTEDFTLISDIDVDNDDTALQKNANYKTLYVYENADATQIMNAFDLNDYFALTSNGKTFSKLSYEVVGATYLSTEENKFIADNSICSLSEGVLTINQTKTISYIGIKVKFGEDEQTYRFRIMPLTFEDKTEGGTYRNYSSINLKELCALTANSEKSLTTNQDLFTNATDINLTNEVTFEIVSGTYSYIEDNKLFISEIQNAAEVQLEVSFNNTILGTITLTISNTLGEYLQNNVYYEEFFDVNYKNESDTSRQYVISDASNYEIEKIIVNGVEFIEREIEEITENKVTTYYLSFTTSNGKIQFGLNKNNVAGKDVYSLNNNVISSINNIVYVYLKSGSEMRYIKLNNYNIVKEESGSYKYYLNGEEKEGLLRFEFIDEKGLVIKNSVVTDETITTSDVSLNRITGELLGTKSDDIYVKIYVKDDVYNTSEKYIIRSLSNY